MTNVLTLDFVGYILATECLVDSPAQIEVRLVYLNFDQCLFDVTIKDHYNVEKIDIYTITFLQSRMLQTTYQAFSYILDL